MTGRDEGDVRELRPNPGCRVHGLQSLQRHSTLCIAYVCRGGSALHMKSSLDEDISRIISCTYILSLLAAHEWNQRSPRLIRSHYQVTVFTPGN